MFGGINSQIDLHNLQNLTYVQFQARSCARGVTAQNAFRLSAPASNMVMVYGLGGIGMSTMAANGLLMKVQSPTYM